MDDTVKNNTQPTPSDPIESELGHITEEIYKKNAQLAQTNKTLSLLRKIDEIILSSVTDTQQIAQEVANASVQDGEFKAVVIFLLDKPHNIIKRLAVSETDAIASLEKEIGKTFKGLETPLSYEDNLVVLCIKEKKIKVTHNALDVLTPHFTEEEAKKIQSQLGVVSVFLYPLIVRGDVIGAILIGISEEENTLSEYKRDLMERLSRVIGIAIDNALLYQKIQEANVRLEQVDKLKDEFVSVASHELRTPMSAIKSYLWMALAGKGGVVSEKQKYYLERAYNSTNRLINLVNDLLNVSRIESGRISLALKDTDIELLVKDTVEEVTPRATELGVNILITPGTDIPIVKADQDKIKEVLINLIGNSLKFSSKGGDITIIIKRDDGFVRISVVDTGKGIERDDIPKLFQKFGRIAGYYTTSQQIEGTGLGLYISKSIVELHGGKIWAESEGEGKGSTFSFTLPVVRSSPAKVSARPSANT